MNLRQKIALGLLLSITLCSAAFAQVVEMPDPNLRVTVREALKLAAGAPITQADMRQLTELEARGKQIKDLSGLQHAINVTRIDFGENDIGDLSPLAALTQLENAELRGNPISDLSPLAKLLRLHTLFAWECQISDVSPLANLTRLKYLDLSFNRIVDIRPLANLTRLFELVIRGNEIVDLTPLANLTNLEMLWIERNNIVDISPLVNLTRLTKLRLNNNEIVDLTPLANLTNLEYLELQNNRITDLTPLANLTNLKRLNTENNPIFDPNSPHVDIPDPNLRAAVREALDLPGDVPITQAAMRQLTKLESPGIQIQDLGGLEHAVNITRIDCGKNPISDLSPLAELTRLSALYIVECQVVDISPLANLTQLRYLDLSYNRVVDISPLSELTGLIELIIRGNEITDVIPLANLTNLESLWIHENSVVDIGPLANLSNLEVLWIQDNNIVDINPLANLTGLTKLWLIGCELSDIGPLANLTRLKYLDLRHNRIVDIRPLANMTQLVELTLSHNQIVDVNPLANLTNLPRLYIDGNLIEDHSPLDALSLSEFRYDEVCEVPPGVPALDRIGARKYPSVFTYWGEELLNRPDLSYIEKTASHDLWCCPQFGVMFNGNLDNPKMITENGLLEKAIQQHDELVSINPNMIFFVTLRLREASFSEYPQDWPYWLRDEQGRIVGGLGSQLTSTMIDGLIDFTHPGFQDLVVAQAIAVSKCGLFDGIFFDWWHDDTAILHDGGSLVYVGAEAEQRARDTIIRRIRAETRPDFLIMGNANLNTFPRTGAYMNGSFMETGVPDDRTEAEAEWALNRIEESLFWLENNLRQPRINALESSGNQAEPADSPNNLRWMRAMTTLSLTFSDGYVVFNYGTGQEHYWYDFWDADLGQPVGAKSQLYDEDTTGLYIREFTNGWAVYNHSGEPQVITLPEEARGVASGIIAAEHTLANIDGEMYLRVKPKNPADVNKDGVVNIFDLTIVAQGFGKDSLEGDVNGDGAVNVFDLVIVANAF